MNKFSTSYINMIAISPLDYNLGRKVCRLFQVLAQFQITKSETGSGLLSPESESTSCLTSCLTSCRAT